MKDSPLVPNDEIVGVDRRYNWRLPLLRRNTESRRVKKVWYVALPLSSAHRGSHSGGGALIAGVEGQDKYLNEGTVYPHASLVELITYHSVCFPEIDWRYIDMSHESWSEVKQLIDQEPPDVVAFTVYTATYVWALICAFQIKITNPSCVIVFGNDHASLMRNEILNGTYGSKVVDYIGIENNGPYTMMNLLYYLNGEIEYQRIPSICCLKNGKLVTQSSPTYPLNLRRLPEYKLIEGYMINHYDKAFAHWYASHYEMKRMVTLPIDGGCTWGANPKRRCKHCSIQGLTPKFGSLDSIVAAAELLVGDMGANIYAAGDSTLGFSSNQWLGQHHFLDDLAEKCAGSKILSGRRFMLAYGLVREFLQSAEICSSFVRTWNVGIEAFDTRLLKNDSKGINGGIRQTIDAFELARKLDYRIYVSGILGLPGTTRSLLRTEIEQWISLAEEYADLITTVSVSIPAIIPGSRMYWDCIKDIPGARTMHGELLPCRKLSRLYIEGTTEVCLEDVEDAVMEVGRGVISVANKTGLPVKFGGYLLGGKDDEERCERHLLEELARQYGKIQQAA